MTRQNFSKKIVFAFILLTATLLLCVSLPTTNAIGGLNFADNEEFTPNTITVSTDEWDTFTYRNASDFNHTVFDGKDAYYYELDCDKDEQYSMTAYVISPALSIFERDYEMTVRYFTRQREVTPNIITVSVSDDGVNYVESDSIYCHDNGVESEVWRQGTLLVKQGKYVRLDLTVYYSGADQEKIADSGIYLDKEIEFTATPSGSYGEEYEVVVKETEFFYNGRAQYPDFTVKTTSNLDYYTVFSAYNAFGDEVEPVLAGKYALKVDIMSDANELVASQSFDYEIKKQELSLVDYQIISNENYAVLLSATFVDGTGRIVDMEEVQADRVIDVRNGAIVSLDNSSFETTSFLLENLQPDVDGNGAIYYLDDVDIVTVYDGGEKSVDGYVIVFNGYDFGTGEFSEIGAMFNVTYKQGQQTLSSLPTDVGAYTYEIECGVGKVTGTLTILPKTIDEAVYDGEGSLDKVYDGTTAVSENGLIVDTLSSVYPIGIVDGQDVSIAFEKVLLARVVGKTYLVCYGGTLSGADSGNYTVAEEVYIDVTATISATGLIWTELRDENHDKVSIADREYDGTSTVTITNDVAVKLVMKGLGLGKVTYGDIVGTIQDGNAGQKLVTFTLTNQGLFDKYLPEIDTGIDAYCNILPKNVNASAVSFDGESKVYDGNNLADVNVYAIALDDYEDIGDGFSTAINGGAYSVDYASATYDSQRVGARTITVSGITLKGMDQATDVIFNNYQINDLVLQGEITPLEIALVTERIRIYKGEALPDVVTTTDAEEIVKATVYATYDDAQAEQNALPDTTKITEVGSYFVKVRCISSDYTFVGNVIIPLEITQAQAKENQYIVLNGVNLFVCDPVVVPVGGTFDLGATSVASDGKKTGIQVYYETSGLEDLGDGKFRANRAGDYTVEMRCYNNEYYYATSASVNIVAKNISISASLNSDISLVVGNKIPSDLVDYLDITADGKGLNGTIYTEQETLLSGTNVYPFTFEMEDTYLPKTVSFAINDVLYEYAEETGYFLTSDTRYVDGKVYYQITPTVIDVEVGDALPSDVYQLDGETYVLSQGIAQEIEYYSLEITVDETRIVKQDGYYVMDGETYSPVNVGEELSTETSYYVFGKEFYGLANLSVTLTAEKSEIEIALGGTVTVEYSEKPDFYASVTSIKGFGMDLPVSTALDYVGMVKLMQVSDSGTERTVVDVSEQTLAVGEYTVFGSGAPDGGYELSLASDGVYNFSFSGSFTLVVEKSKVVVSAKNYDKYYYATGMTAEEILNELVIDGSYLPSDREEILSGIEIAVGATRVAPVADYAIILTGGIGSTDSYEISYKNGYVSVIPAEITVFATSNGHVYGTQPAELRKGMIISAGSNAYYSDDRELLRQEVLKYVEVYCSVSENSDVGTYYVDVYFVGDTTNYNVSFGNSVYTVSPATIKGVTFDDEKVLYDGKKHSLEIEYDETALGTLTVKYDKGAFVEKGIYEYTATVSKKNYKDLVLTAELTIGTLTVNSSSVNVNAVSVTVLESEFNNGLSPDIYAELVAMGEEDLVNLTEKVKERSENSNIQVIAGYDVELSENGYKVYLGNTAYALTLSPTDVKSADGIKIYGYGDDGYGELEYEYTNGKFSINVRSLSGIAFVKETEDTTSPIIVWISVAIFVVIVLFVLSIVFGGGKRGRREKARSRKRHHRWA